MAFRAIVLLFLLLPVWTARAEKPPAVILYYSAAPTVRAAFREDRPNLQALLRESGVALLITGPTDTDPYVSLQAGRYVSVDEADSADSAAWPDGALHITEPRHDIARGDRLLGALRERYPHVPVIATHPARWRPEGSHASDRLAIPAWIAITGQHGRLYSETVRRAGIVSNLDVLPTLQRQASGTYDHALPGRPIWGDGLSGTPVKRGLPYHLEAAVVLQDALLTMARVTPAALAVLGFGGGGLLLAAIALLWPRRQHRASLRARRLLQYGFLALLLIPVGYILAAERQPATPAAFAFATFGAVGGMWFFAVVAGRLLADSAEDKTPAMLQMATGVSVAVILVNTLRDGYGILLAPLSNYYLTGIRFYGVGNEYAALFIGYVALFGLLTVQRARARSLGAGGLALLGAWFAMGSFVLGWPAYGANMGGMLAGLAAGGVAWGIAARRAGARFAWAWPVLVGALTVALVVWSDAHSPSATHVGRFARGIAEGGAGPLAVLWSKAVIFWNVLWSGWALMCLLFGAGLAFLMRGPLAPTARRLRRRWGWVALSLPALLLGGLFGAMVNDSGVVVLGLMVVVPIAVLAALALEPAELTMAEDSGWRGDAGRG